MNKHMEFGVNRLIPMLWTVCYHWDAAISEDWALNLVREGQLPFFPRDGMYIDPGDGDLHKVDGVYWNANERKLEVHFEELDDIYTKEHLLETGWEEWTYP